MITGKDIADATGFALSTVEKVLRGHSARYKINPATTRNILETARKLGYHRNEAAVITRTGVNRTVGIFALQTSDMHAVQSKIISGIVSEAAHHDYSVTMFRSTLEQAHPEHHLSCGTEPGKMQADRGFLPGQRSGSGFRYRRTEKQGSGRHDR